MKKIIAFIKKIVAIVKKAIGLAKTVTPEQKQEIKEIATNVVKALDEVKAKKETVALVEEAPKAPAKKKKKYYKPKAKSNSL